MTYSRVARHKRASKKEQTLRYSLRKASTVGLASAVVGVIGFHAPVAVQAEEITQAEVTVLAETPATEDELVETLVAEDATETTDEAILEPVESSVEEDVTDSETDESSEVVITSVVTEQENSEILSSSEVSEEQTGTEETAEVAETSETTEASTEEEKASETSNENAEAEATSLVEDTQKYTSADDIEAIVLTETDKKLAAAYGLTSTAYQIALAANLYLPDLNKRQIEALNRMQLRSDAETGLRMTYKEFEEIADLLVAQDSRYAIPYFNASLIENLPAATTRTAQGGRVAELDSWDSWPVQDIKTGEVVNWNGYQLVIAMMGVPGTNDHHIYLLYNTYGDNELSNWKMVGSIFGYEETPVSQEWSGSATVNSDGTIQLYYTRVDTSDNHSNNQMLATATLVLSHDENGVYLDAVENDKVLTPQGGDGYYYQSYAQWRSTFSGADNIAMRDPHVIEDTDGQRYLIFEASTGSQNYQGENQIYVWDNYGGDAAYNVKSLFRFLENDDMYDRAAWANAAIGILRIEGDEKNPEVVEYYTPILSSPMVSDEIERPTVMKIGDKYYMFAATRLNHGSNNDAWNLANDIVGDNVVMVGYVSDTITSGYTPLNGNGVVLTASVPADWKTATYSYYPVPVPGHDDLLLVTAYMTNRNGVAGEEHKSTFAPSFLIKLLPDGTTVVLNAATNQGDWIWDESSYNPNMIVDLDQAYLPGENDGIVDWTRVGGYGLINHKATPYENKPIEPNETPKTSGTPEVPVVTPEEGGAVAATNETKPATKKTAEKSLPNTSSVEEKSSIVTGLALLGFASLFSLARKARKEA